MADLDVNLKNRKWLMDRLKAEIVGPDAPDKSRAIEIDRARTGEYTWDQFRKPKIQPNGEEILWQDAPLKRYGAGILFPAGITEEQQLAAEASAASEDEEIEEVQVEVPEELEKRQKPPAAADDSENYDVTLSNAYRPSALGMSFLAELTKESVGLAIEVAFATYKRVGVRVVKATNTGQISNRDLWFRTPGTDLEGNKPIVEFAFSEISGQIGRMEKAVPGSGEPGLKLVVVVRKYDAEDGRDLRLITISLVNRKVKDEGRLDEASYFQCGFRVSGTSKDEWIVPYPESSGTVRSVADEEQILKLLYRDRLTYAIGHGCAADWKNGHVLVSEIWTETLPAYETTGVSADIKDFDGRTIQVSMRKLAGLVKDDDGSGEIKRLVGAYRKWIEDLEDFDNPKQVVPGVDRPPIPRELNPTARILLGRCKECLSRIEAGVAFLNGESKKSMLAKSAFKLANEAMMLAQYRASRDVRKPVGDVHDHLVWDPPFPSYDPAVVDERKGYWRAFQIAFLLMSVCGICDPGHQERDVVDLIWFPTGGGKTEAYLGLTAFTIFFNRLSGNITTGIDVLMRYTLRLLTAQQFQRAGLLFCAMEYIRMREKETLGEKSFRLGLWVGGDVTPNKRQDAKKKLESLQRDCNEENPFIILKCPWCGAKMGPNEMARGRMAGNRGGVLGYEEALTGARAKTVVFKCPDRRCHFSGRIRLPIVVIDEDILDDPPNLVIGTVDKFASLAWNPEMRKLFGIGENGKHQSPPPTLIIQDELHLISGPLGSMVGAYETVIEECATRREGGKVIQKPKIIASTATISRAEEQVRHLYARDRVMLFPPSGLEANDSFFAREARGEDGTPEPGRIYLGIMAPGHGSQQTTQARIFASLLQNTAIMPVGKELEKDPWWTMLCFFNSLRELGGASTLLVADARDYLRVILDRHGIGYGQIRQLLNWQELTSRIRGDQVPVSIQKLETPFALDERGYVSKETVDACLASNIIEVGVDIDRLSLMVIVGQPKTTSQYIQVSSRVGRRRSVPGLVVVGFSQSKPRDRSHYERFRSYHQRLYAQVEPTSVTPFSPPAVDRALHGVVVAAVRQLADMTVARSPRPFPLEEGTELFERILRMLENRVSVVDSEESEEVRQKLSLRLKQWKTWNPSEYGGFGTPPTDPPLIYPAGSNEPAGWDRHSWPVLSSLRNVDATCEAEITSWFTNVPEVAEP